MSKNIKKFKINLFNKNTSGFTLVELLVVVVVITVLSGVTLSVLNSQGVRGKARDGQRKGDLSKIQSALELYFVDNRTYPISAWTQINGSNDAVSAAIKLTYINVVPIDPLNNGSSATPCSNKAINRYNYWSDGGDYLLTSIMEVETSDEISRCDTLPVFTTTHCTSGDTYTGAGDVCYGVQNP